MRVSVIIITFNRAKLLRGAIGAILNQTFRDFELIIVDNFSEDDTESIVKSFDDKRIRYFKNANNGILAINLNYGMKKAGGDYIAFCDSDDLWMPDKLEKQVEYLEKYPEYCLVYSNANIVDENDVKHGLLLDKKDLKNGKIFEELVEYNFIPICTVLMRREIIDNVGFFNESQSVRPGEDYEYLLRAALRYKIGVMEEPLAMYREHSGMMSRKINFPKVRQNILALITEDPLAKNRNKIAYRIYSLYPPSAIYNWKNSDTSTAKEDITTYINYAFRRIRLLDIPPALFLWILFNFNYNALRKVKKRVLS